MGCRGCAEKKGSALAVPGVPGEEGSLSAAVEMSSEDLMLPLKVDKAIRALRLELCKQCNEMVHNEDGSPTDRYLVGEWEGELHCGNPNNPEVASDAERYGCGCAVEELATWENAQCPRLKWGPGHEIRSDIIPMFTAPREGMLPGVIDYIGPTHTPDGVSDCSGIGDVMVQCVVAQALQRFHAARDIKVRFLTVNGRLSWAALAAPDLEIHSLSDMHRTPGEFVQHSAPLRALEIDATCRMQGQNRHQFLAAQLGVPKNYVEEWDVRINDDAMAVADDFLTIPKKDGRPIICVSPHSNSPTRQWPLRHWCQLIERLKHKGFAVFILHRPIPPGVPDPIRSIPVRRFGSNDPHQVAAVIQQSDMTVGCDSGMCHVAGLLRKPALAVCGPTVGSIVFGGWPTVRQVQAPGSCTGCLWFQENGWKPWCGFGCGALADTQPSMVEPRIENILKEIGRL